MMRTKTTILTVWICFLFFAADVTAQNGPPAQIIDGAQLAGFFGGMSEMYRELKQITNLVIEGKISVADYKKIMGTWREKFDTKDAEAPCPKNNWQRHYSRLTPIHYDICFAWADLGGLHTSLLTSDPDLIIYHEQNFREGTLVITEKFEHPGLNQEKTGLFD